MWLHKYGLWPENPVTLKSDASEDEGIVSKEVLNLANEKPKQQLDMFNKLLEHHDLRQVLHILAWRRCFTTHKTYKGSLTSEDLQESKNWWIKIIQKQASEKPPFEQTRLALNLIPNSN